MNRGDLQLLRAEYWPSGQQRLTAAEEAERNRRDFEATNARCDAETAAFERAHGATWTDPPRRSCTLCGGDGLHCNAVDCPAQFGRRAPAFCLRSFLWGIGLASMVGLVVTVTVGEWLLTAMGGAK